MNAQTDDKRVGQIHTHGQLIILCTCKYLRGKSVFVKATYMRKQIRLHLVEKKVNLFPLFLICPIASRGQLLNYATSQNICWLFFRLSSKTLVFLKNFQDSLKSNSFTITSGFYNFCCSLMLYLFPKCFETHCGFDLFEEQAAAFSVFPKFDD